MTDDTRFADDAHRYALTSRIATGVKLARLVTSPTAQIDGTLVCE